MRTRSFLALAACALVLLAGCNRADNADTTPSAASDEPMALMQAAFPGWKADGAAAVRSIVSPPGQAPDGKPTPAEEDTYKLSPALVIPLAANRVVLIVAGEPADTDGDSRAGHGTPALLGAYWFEKRGERWFKVAEQPDFGHEGFNGDPGELRRQDMGGGTIGLSVENGSCWQGSCGHFLGLYRIGDTHIDNVFNDLLSSDSEGAMESCSDLQKLAAGQHRHLSQEEYSTAFGCYNIDGHWQIQSAPQGQGPGPLVIEFTGKETDAKAVPHQPTAKTGNPEAKANEEEAGDDEPEEDYLVTVRTVRQKQTYRFTNGRYQLIQGKNPNPGL